MTIQKTIEKLIRNGHRNGHSEWTTAEVVDELSPSNPQSYYTGIHRMLASGALVVTQEGQRGSKKNPRRFTIARVAREWSDQKNGTTIKPSMHPFSEDNIKRTSGVSSDGISSLDDSKLLKSAQAISDKKQSASESQPKPTKKQIPEQSSPSVKSGSGQQGVLISENYRMGYRNGCRDSMQMIRDGVIPIESLVLQLARDGVVSAESLIKLLVRDGLASVEK